MVFQVTSSPMWDYSPIWSHDSQYILFGSNRDNTLGRVPFFIASSLGSGTEEIALLAGKAIEASHPADWSMDGGTILYTRHNPETGFDVWSLPATDGPPFDESRATPFVATGSRDGEARFSRDGKLVAYTSGESGQPEVYVQPFPGPGAKVRVSTDGGSQPLWRADGRELFYLASDGSLMAVPIAVGDRFTPGEAESLFEAGIYEDDMVERSQYAVTADGQQFLVIVPADESFSPPVTVIVNWSAELENQ